MNQYTTEGKKQLIKEASPGSPLGKNLVKAFFFGGIICGGGEALKQLFLSLGVSERDAPMLVSLSVIALAAALTLIGVFDSIAKHAGAGTLVPISGFSNSVISQAMDARSEGFVLGVGAKIFTVCGPVILFVLASGTLYGIIYYFLSAI